MEFNHHHSHGFLEEMYGSNINGFGFNDLDDQFDQNTLLATPFVESSPFSITSSSFEDFSFSTFDIQTLNSFGQHFINPHELLSAATFPHMTTNPSNIKLESSNSPLNDHDYYSMFSMLDDSQNCHYHVSNPEGAMANIEPDERPTTMFKKNIGKVPSKNLMAERRRRKRLNDRLYMLRSVVPKISKMDRTSILADTIDYMKELIQKINHMKQEPMDMNPLGISFIRNSPKFDVEKREGDIRVQVCCSGKPELLISTMSTLEALGLQIHQCVISCFNDFTMHASCSQETEQRLMINPDDIKQALFRNAGYSGRCL